MKKANRLRMEFISKAFSELGFAGDDLEMRTMLFACYHNWEAPMFPSVSRKRRKALIAKRVDLLTANAPSWVRPQPVQVTHVLNIAAGVGNKKRATAE